MSILLMRDSVVDLKPCSNRLSRHSLNNHNYNAGFGSKKVQTSVSALPFLLVHEDYGDEDVFEINKKFFSKPPVELKYLQHIYASARPYNEQKRSKHKNRSKQIDILGSNYKSNMPFDISYYDDLGGRNSEKHRSRHSHLPSIRYSRGENPIIEIDTSCNEYEIFSSLVKHANKKRDIASSIGKKKKTKKHKKSRKIKHVSIDNEVSSDSDNSISHNVSQSISQPVAEQAFGQNNMIPQFNPLAVSVASPMPFNENRFSAKPDRIFNFTSGTLVPNSISSVMNNFFPSAFKDSGPFLDDQPFQFPDKTEAAISMSDFNVVSTNTDDMSKIEFRDTSLKPKGLFSLKTTDLDTILDNSTMNVDDTQPIYRHISVIPLGFNKVTNATENIENITKPSRKSNFSVLNRLSKLTRTRSFTENYDRINTIPPVAFSNVPVLPNVRTDKIVRKPLFQRIKEALKIRKRKRRVV